MPTFRPALLTAVIAAAAFVPVVAAQAAPTASAAQDAAALVGSVLAVPATETANADGKVAFASKPILVKTSGGAYVEYVLNRDATKHAITIGGHKARFYVDRHAGSGHYRGFVEVPRMVAGRTYTVKIVVTRPGKDIVRVDRLVLRSRHPVAPAVAG
jgi:hypothetical protein